MRRRLVTMFVIGLDAVLRLAQVLDVRELAAAIEQS
jgi:hypothetical protein